MPYISKQDREYLKDPRAFPQSAGELNYSITMLLKEYLRWHSVCYRTFNEIIGVLECAKLEMYRRMVAPYEDEKRQENGDVYYPIEEVPDVVQS